MSKVGNEGSFRLLLLCAGNTLDLLLVRLLESHPEDLIQICGFFTNDKIVKERLSDFSCCGLLLDFKHALHAF